MAADSDEIAAFGFDEAMGWLDGRGIDYDMLESLAEMQDLIRASIQCDSHPEQSIQRDSHREQAPEDKLEIQHQRPADHLEVTNTAICLSQPTTAAGSDEIEAFDFEQAMKWLDDNGENYDNLESLDEMKDLIRACIRYPSLSTLPAAAQDSTTPPPPSPGHAEELMQEIVRQDKIMRMTLSRVHDALRKFLATQLDNGIKEVLRHSYGNFDTTLDEYKRELEEGDCAILIAGETSAGKSSFLNLLLGESVLPVALLSATSTICCLRNSTTKAFTLVAEDGGHESVTIETDKDIDRLKTCVGSRPLGTESQYKHVDIYWPLPILQDCVTIVDSPGVGESDELTQRLVEYLPRAVAFIYVINSANAGGVQEDRLLHIIRSQQQWALDRGLFRLDTGSLVFVCNKWDVVEGSGQGDDVWDRTLEKLVHVLPDVTEKQVFRMSTTEANRYMASGMGYTEKFKNLLRGIEEMVPRSLKAKVKRHYRWLERFLKKIQSIIVAHINHAHATKADLHTLYDTVAKRLKGLQTNAQKVRLKLTREAEQRCSELAAELYEHLNSPDVVCRLTTWEDGEAPEADNDDLHVTKLLGEKLIMARIEQEVRAWQRANTGVQQLADGLAALFTQECNVLGQLCDEVDLLIEGVGDVTDDLQAMAVDSSEEHGDHHVLFDSSEKLFLAVSAPLWIPLVTVASVLFVPLGAGYLMSETSRKKQKRRDYSENKAKFMSGWAATIISACFTKESLTRFIFRTYFERFQAKISALCDDFIPKQIAADKSQIDGLQQDLRTSSEILKQYKPVHQKLKAVFGKLYMFDLEYMHTGRDNIRGGQLRRVRRIGRGSFSDVHLGEWEPGDRTEKVAVKELRQTLKGESGYIQYLEIHCLRCLRHDNIVTFYGYSFSCPSEETMCHSGHKRGGESGKDGVAGAEMGVTKCERGVVGCSRLDIAATLSLVFELCEENLEERVFRDKELQCRFSDSTDYQNGAFRFFVTMAAGVCSGLSHIHQNGFIHRDLKLSNVLIKAGVAKICDLGCSQQEVDITGTFAGTLTHMSPELLSGRPYGSPTDIYSLAILLWELWHARHVHMEPEYAAAVGPGIGLIDTMRAGTRPSLSHEYRMPLEVEALVRRCWDQDPLRRPTAAQVGSVLRSVYSSDKATC